MTDAIQATKIVYFHIGSGITTSRYYCRICDGYYGVPHGDFHRKRAAHFDRDCACRMCQERSGRYPSEGTFKRVTMPLPRKLPDNWAEPLSAPDTKENQPT